jgi:uncharacterized protein (DUF2345 family)
MGEITPFSELAALKDGCQMNNRLGHRDHCNCPEFNQRFQLVNEDTGDPVPGMRYEILTKSTGTISGITDSNGFTKKVEGKLQESGEFKLYYDRNLNPKP